MTKLYFKSSPAKSELKGTMEIRSSKLDYATMHSHLLLHRFIIDFETNIDAFFDNYKLSPGRFTLLTLLKQNPEGMSPTEMAEKVGVTQATISGLIKIMLEANLIRRLPMAKDGRRVTIQLTEEGEST